MIFKDKETKSVVNITDESMLGIYINSSRFEEIKEEVTVTLEDIKPKRTRKKKSE